MIQHPIEGSGVELEALAWVEPLGHTLVELLRFYSRLKGFPSAPRVVPDLI